MKNKDKKETEKDLETILMELIGGRPPENEMEREIVAELKEAEENGYIPHIPSNG
jgi:hypothetical protein